MDRRRFISLIGGGSVAAVAAAALPGCSRALPPEAIAPWQGPGAETDLRRWLLSWALLAPHSHNLQSWQVDLREPDTLTLYCDLERLLPETDPHSRQIMMSHGTFIELLELGARERGQRAEITLFPEGAPGPERLDARPVARMRLVPDASVTRDPLFGMIPRRHTNREAYDAARPVMDAAWQAMAAAAGTGIGFGYLGAGTADVQALARQRAIASEAWRIELTTPRTILESYRVLRVGAAEIAQHRDGLSLTDPMVVAMTRLGLFDRTKAPAADDFAIRSQIEDFDAKLASTTGFLWLVSADDARATQVAAGRAYARVQLAATAAGVAMQPISQALQEYAEVAAPYREIHALLAPQGGTVQMWARVGHAPAVGPAPRRPLDAIIRE